MMRKLAAAFALATWLTIPAAGALAGTAEEEAKERAEALAREGIERIIQALDLLIDAIPQYEWPEVNEEGDIIIAFNVPVQIALGPNTSSSPIGALRFLSWHFARFHSIGSNWS